MDEAFFQTLLDRYDTDLSREFTGSYQKNKRSVSLDAAKVDMPVGIASPSAVGETEYKELLQALCALRGSVCERGFETIRMDRNLGPLASGRHFMD